jgi:hypothetical protein
LIAEREELTHRFHSVAERVDHLLAEGVGDPVLVIAGDLLARDPADLDRPRGRLVDPVAALGGTADPTRMVHKTASRKWTSALVSPASSDFLRCGEGRHA